MSFSADPEKRSRQARYLGDLERAVMREENELLELERRGIRALHWLCEAPASASRPRHHTTRRTGEVVTEAACSLYETGLDLGVSVERARQIEEKAIRKIRAFLQSPRGRQLREELLDLLHEVARQESRLEPESLWEQTVRAFNPSRRDL